MMTRRAAWCGLLLAALAGWTGCGRGGATYVTQFPRWDFEQYKRLAVLPGRASTPQGAREAGVLTDQLTTGLTQSGAFTILSRADMKSVFAEQDLSRLEDAIDANTALPEGKIEIAQALVAARITEYKLIADRTQQAFPIYARDRRGAILIDRFGRPIIVGEDVVTVYRHGAEVEGSVRVIDAATGKVLLSHSARIAPRPRTARNQPPSQMPEQIAADAVHELAVEFVKVISPTRLKVKLKADMLIVATAYFDGKYTTEKKLPRNLNEFLIAVRDLPDECDRNNFRVAVAEVDGQQNLFEQEFVWSGSSGAEGMSFRVPTEALTKAGGEKFVAKLYSVGNPEPILKRDFSLGPAKGE